MAVDDNPIDALWTDRPAPPAGPVSLRDIKFAGESAADKLKRIQAELTKLRADVLVVSDPQNVAWAFNIRGADVRAYPLALAFAVIPREGRPALYVDGAKLDNKVRHALEEIAAVRAPDDLARDLAQFKDKTVRLDSASAADALTRLVAGSGGKPVRGADPIALMKAVKNHAEIAGSRAAHKRDGAAMVRFLAWLEREAPTGTLTEIDAVEALESFRRDTGLLKDISFPTIAGSGPNGAIVHYQVTRASNRTHRQQRAVPGRFRRAIRGRHHRYHPHRRGRHADRGNARPLHPRAQGPHRHRHRGVSGEHQRRPARSAGAHCRCGRPGSISITAPATASAAICRCTRARRASPSSARVALRRGMILSNEPGYYKTAAYGIRIENLVLVIAAPEPAGAEKPLNAFETLTLAPIDRRLIDTRLLTAKERNWIDSYHARVQEVLGPAARCADAALARRGDQAAWKHLMDARTSASRAAKQAGHALAAAGAADGDDRHRPGHAQHPGAGAAGAGRSGSPPTPARCNSRCRSIC